MNSRKRSATRYSEPQTTSGRGASPRASAAARSAAASASAAARLSHARAPAGGSDAAAHAAGVRAQLSAALYDLLPTDVIAETAAQMKSGFGLLHKWQKRREEEARSVERLRNPAERKRSRFASKGSAGAGAGGAEDGGAASPRSDDAAVPDMADGGSDLFSGGATDAAGGGRDEDDDVALSPA